MAAVELRKGVGRSIQLDEMFFTESNHAELTQGDGGPLGGITSAFVADHVQLPSELGKSYSFPRFTNG